MRDISQKQWEAGRPHIDAISGINFCLDQLYLDGEKDSFDVVAGCCSYEELIGSLLVARDELRRLSCIEADYELLLDDLSMVETLDELEELKKQEGI